MTSLELKAEVEAFVHREARLADEFQLDEWEELLTDDFHYWVPAGRLEGNPADQLSYLNDNRARVATRVRQLKTGKRLSQLPMSPMRRVVSNLEILEGPHNGDRHNEDRDTEYEVAANFVIYELAAQSSRELRVWPGHVRYRLRRSTDGLQMAAKWVELVTAEAGLRNLTFLI
ncbi:MAG: aromatic-ring-hydroxylating dioxygenase subunit beta [Actinomycetota bacterium]|jgi:benzoate/toluate 1,2-dioxygenase subunit beta|nr:aromatic-ring-hydroxylating dioxygenase subunit beta [Actinomycetota bacterium]